MAVTPFQFGLYWEMTFMNSLPCQCIYSVSLVLIGSCIELIVLLRMEPQADVCGERWAAALKGPVNEGGSQVCAQEPAVPLSSEIKNLNLYDATPSRRIHL